MARLYSEVRNAMRVRPILCALLFAMFAPGVAAQSGSPTKDWLLTDKGAVRALAPSLAAADGVESGQWSTDGRFVLMRRTSYRLTPQVVKGLIDRSIKEPPG